VVDRYRLRNIIFLKYKYICHISFIVICVAGVLTDFHDVTALEASSLGTDSVGKLRAS